MVRQPAVNRSSRRFDSFRWSSSPVTRGPTRTGSAGSTPARAAKQLARWSNGRTPDRHSETDGFSTRAMNSLGACARIRTLPRTRAPGAHLPMFLEGRAPASYAECTGSIPDVGSRFVLSKRPYTQIRWFDSNRLLRERELASSYVGEPMVRHSFSQMRPHTAVSSLGRNDTAHALDGSSTRLVRGEDPVRFRTWAPVPPNRTDPTRT